MSKMVTINGESASESQWAKKLHVTRGAIWFRKKKFGESSEEAVRHFFYRNIVENVAEDIVRNLKFYNDSYIKSSMKSLSYALPNLVGEVDGAGRILSRVIADLEEVARITDLHIKQLETKGNEVEG